VTSTAYKDHPLRAAVNRILEMRKSPEFAIEEVAGNESYAFARDKSFAIVQALHDLLQQTPAELTSSVVLGQLNANIQTPLNELTSFLGNKNPGHLTNAATYLEQNILSLFWGFTPQAQKTAKTTFPALIDLQASAAKQAINALQDQRDKLLSRIEDIATTTTSLEASLEQVSTGAAKERAEAASTVAKLEQLFTEKETERQNMFDATVKEFHKEFSEFSTNSLSSSSNLISELQAQRDKAARIVQVVGDIGATGNYQRTANAESKQANFWRWVTVGIFAAGICLAGATFYKFWGQPLTTDTALSVLIRLLYAIAITAPAWYTAKESARHRTNADRARQTELELASIGPFIELLPEDKKNEIREKLTPLYFGRAVETHNVTSPFDSTVIKDFVEMIKAVKK
jgi:hypothetical protein